MDLGIISTILNVIFGFFFKIIVWAIVAVLFFFVMLAVGTTISEGMDLFGIDPSPMAIGSFVCCGFPLMAYLAIFAIAWAITRKRRS